jgi:pyridoxal biosynthesis lyase PdxS
MPDSRADLSVIMDVMNAEQAKIAEEAGACAVMALERIPANIRRDGGVARMVRNVDSDLEKRRAHARATRA